MLLGPPLAGVLIGIFGAASVLVIDAATYVVSFVLVLCSCRGRARARRGGGVARAARRVSASSIREPLLRVWIPLFVAGDAAWQAFFAAVPVLDVERFGADAKIAGAALRRLRRRRARRELPLVPLPRAAGRRAAPDRALGAVPGAAALAAARWTSARRVMFVGDPRQRHRERRLQSDDPRDLHAADAAGDPREGDGGEHDDLGPRHAARARHRRPGADGVRRAPGAGRLRRRADASAWLGVAVASPARPAEPG